MKLSKAQKRILELMNSNWELGSYEGLNSDYVLQEGGCGYGGKTIRNINWKTIKKLSILNLLKIKKKSYPKTTYKLTPKGKQLLEKIK